MVNYACGLNQSETGKYFEWIINVAYGFQTGHHYCGEQEFKSCAICYRSSGHICVLWVSENYGSAAIKISLIQASKHDDFLCIQVWEEFTYPNELMWLEISQN